MYKVNDIIRITDKWETGPYRVSNKKISTWYPDIKPGAIFAVMDTTGAGTSVLEIRNIGEQGRPDIKIDYLGELAGIHALFVESDLVRGQVEKLDFSAQIVPTKHEFKECRIIRAHRSSSQSPPIEQSNVLMPYPEVRVTLNKDKQTLVLTQNDQSIEIAANQIYQLQEIINSMVEK